MAGMGLLGCMGLRFRLSRLGDGVRLPSSVDAGLCAVTSHGWSMGSGRRPAGLPMAGFLFSVPL